MKGPYDNCNVGDAVIAALCAGSLMFVGGMFVGAKAMEEVMQSRAVNHGCAEYDSKTGKWRWNDERRD